MTDPAPQNGSILSYPYLWKWQQERGETEGRKSRPVCMVLAIKSRDQTHLILLAISGTPPRSDQTTLPIPRLEKRRAGLKGWKDAWITVSEYNYDIAETSFYYHPNAPILGHFSKNFLARVAAAARPFIANAAAQINRSL